MERVALLISDLDGTLLGDDAALEKFKDGYARVKDYLRLVYSSGRFFDSIQESIIEYRLPTPDAIICGVGTEIHDVSSGQQLEGWPILRGGWEPRLVMETCLTDCRLQLQPAEFLSRHKISYYGRDLDDTVLNQLSRQLFDAGQRATLIYSSNRDLDVLPEGIHKGSAADYLVQSWEIERDRTIVAGDSGNDLTMFQQGFRGIVVGNAQPELRANIDQGVYQATGHFAAGVMEGLKHWLAEIENPPLQPID